MSKNVILGMTKRGEKVCLSDRRVNGHIAVFGCSGSGKSTEALSLALQHLAIGNTVIVINWRRCLEVENIMPEFVNAYLNSRVRIDVARDKLKIPLFSNIKDIKGNVESDSSVIHRVTNMLKIAGCLTATQTAVVKNAVSEVYDKKLYQKSGIRIVSRFLEAQDYNTALNAAGRLCNICDENLFVDGNFMDDIKGKICEIDLNGLQYDDQNSVVNAVLDYILRMANMGHFKNNNITIFIDECQNLSFAPESTMSVFLNETRKMGVNLILVAPRIVTGSSKRSMSVIQQSGVVLDFMPVAEDRRKIAKRIDPSRADAQVFNLSELKRGQFVASGIFSIGENERKGPLTLDTYIPEKLL